MGLFGSIFGGSKAVNPYDQMGDIINPPMRTPGFGDGTPQGGRIPLVDLPGDSMTGPMTQLATDPRISKALKPGLFGKGGDGWKAIGILGDALQIAGGGRATWMPFMQGREQQDREAAQAMDLARIKAQYKSPTSLQQNLAYYRQINPGATDAEISAIIRANLTRPIMGGEGIYDPAALYGGEGGQAGGRSVTRTGTDASGRKVVQYNDGSIEYAD